MKKQITTITKGSLPALNLDAGESWKEWVSLTPSERCEEMGTWHFTIHLPHMDLPPRIKKRFWNHFSCAKAEIARAVAAMGTKAANHCSEMSLALDAIGFHQDIKSGRIKNELKNGKNPGLAIAAKFSEMAFSVAKSGDAAPLRRLITILESNMLPIGDRGGISSEDGFMLQQFTELHTATRSLPTKAELRKACGLNKLDDKKLADKRMKKLGLAGLPTELEI